MQDENIKIIQTLYEAYRVKNFAAGFAFFSPEIEICQCSSLPWGGYYKGIEAAKEFFSKFTSHVDSCIKPYRFINSQHSVVVLARSVGKVRRTNVPFDITAIHVWTLRDSKVTRLESYIDMPEMVAALSSLSESPSVAV